MGKNQKGKRSRLRRLRSGQGLTQHPSALQAPGAEHSVHKTFHPPERTIERKMGCYNCRHFTNGDLALQHYKSMRQRDIKVLRDRGLKQGQIDRAVANQDRLVKPPRTGICLIGKSESDFVHPIALCDSWDGRVRVEGPVDPLVEEVREDLDGSEG